MSGANYTPTYTGLACNGRTFAGVVELVDAAERGELGRAGLVWGLLAAGGRMPLGSFRRVGAGLLEVDIEPAEEAAN